MECVCASSHRFRPLGLPHASKQPETAGGRIALTSFSVSFNSKKLLQSSQSKIGEISRTCKILAQGNTRSRMDVNDPLEDLHKDQDLCMVKVKFLLQRRCNFGQQFSITGSHPHLGSWDPKAAIPLEWSEGDIWSVEMNIPAGKKIEYKFILKGKNGEITWQPGSNRIFEASPYETSLIVSSKWEKEDTLLPDIVCDTQRIVDEAEDTLKARSTESETIDESKLSYPSGRDATDRDFSSLEFNNTKDFLKASTSEMEKSESKESSFNPLNAQRKANDEIGDD